MAQPFYREAPNGRIEHRAEPAMLVLALLIIPALLMEDASSPELRTAASVLNVVIWLGFVVELGFVLIVATNRRRTLRAHWLDAVIVAVSVPVFPQALQSARALRVLRLLRFVRLAAAGARAAVAARRVFRPSSMPIVLVFVGVLVLVAGAAMSWAERSAFASVDDGVWWALETVTTVGYGDVVPHTTYGRILAAFVMLLGISFVAVLTASIAAMFVGQDERPAEVRAQLDALQQRMDETAAQLDRIELALQRIGQRE
jgi:voltage-gated potassium channel